MGTRKLDFVGTEELALVSLVSFACNFAGAEYLTDLANHNVARKVVMASRIARPAPRCSGLAM